MDKQYILVGTTRLPVVMDTFEDAYELLRECMEEGYDYHLCTYEVSIKLNVDNAKRDAMLECMQAHDKHTDPEYLDFRVALENILVY